MKFEAYADLATMGTPLVVAAEQTSFIKHDGVEENSQMISRTVRALLITKCEGKVLSLVSLVFGRHGLEAWQVLKEECEGKVGFRAALLRGILNPSARLGKMHSEGHDLGDILASFEEDVAKYQVVEGADLQQAVQVATVMEHAPAAYRDLLEVVPLAPKLACKRARVDTSTEIL